MIIRLTEKLAKKIKEIPLNSLPPDPNPFADWTARLFTHRRVQYILITNTATLYSVLIYGSGITDYDTFIHTMGDSLRDMMEDDGFPRIYYDYVAPRMARIAFARTNNRSVTSSMNRLAFYAQIHMEYDEISPYDASFKLNKSIMKYGKQHEYPREMLAHAADRLSNVLPLSR